MHAGRISGTTRTLGPPADWNKEDDGPCGRLAIRDEPTTAGIGMTSAWFPTPEEIIRLQAGAPIYLTIIGMEHPPVDLQVGAVPE